MLLRYRICRAPSFKSAPFQKSVHSSRCRTGVLIGSEDRLWQPKMRIFVPFYCFSGTKLWKRERCNCDASANRAFDQFIDNRMLGARPWQHQRKQQQLQNQQRKRPLRQSPLLRSQRPKLRPKASKLILRLRSNEACSHASFCFLSMVVKKQPAVK